MLSNILIVANENFLTKITEYTPEREGKKELSNKHTCLSYVGCAVCL